MGKASPPPSFNLTTGQALWSFFTTFIVSDSVSVAYRNMLYISRYIEFSLATMWYQQIMWWSQVTILIKNTDWPLTSSTKYDHHLHFNLSYHEYDTWNAIEIYNKKLSQILSCKNCQWINLKPYFIYNIHYYPHTLMKFLPINTIANSSKVTKIVPKYTRLSNNDHPW